MSKVNCAVVGAGWWATTAHIPAIKKHPQAELLAVQKRKREAVESLARDFEVPHACTTLEEVLAVPDLDAVVVSSTPNMHFPHAAAALEKGLHVLIEKPMTLTVAEAQKLVSMAEDKGAVFIIGCPFHYTPHALEAQRLAGPDHLGELKMISILHTNFSEGLYKGLGWDELSPGHEVPEPYYQPGVSSYCDPAVSGGGHIYTMGSHVAAYVSFLTGHRASEVFARFDNHGTKVDVSHTVNIRMDNGAIVSLAGSGATMPSERHLEMRVYGTKGMLLLELWHGKMEFHDLSGEVKRFADLTEEEIFPSQAPAVNLIEAISEGATVVSPAIHGLESMRIIEGACRSVSEGKNILL